jgi:pimeloyl-ACP methyl ester carboxylesterase
MTTGTITEQRATVNGLDFAYLEAGEGPLALCLHGFPDTPWGWRWLLPALAEAGFHAVAPFARGYAPTAVPDDGGSSLGAWVADATAFHEALGGDQPGVVIGHDWGALTTYGATAHAPQRWRRCVTASIPPGSVMAGRLARYEQVRAFWYQYVFLQPNAEDIVSGDDLAFLAGLWADWSPGFDAADELPRVKDALRNRANLTAALDTYRSIFGVTPVPPEFAEHLMATFAPVAVPTLYLHGRDDTCVPASVVDDVPAALPPGSRVEVIDDAGHFVQYEQPELVRDLVVEWVTA